MKKFVLAGVALAAVAAVPTIAQNAARPDRNAPVSRADVESRVKTAFERLDANRDGYVTREEGQSVRKEARADRREGLFARLDTDRNGAISREEFDAPRTQAAERGERRGNRAMRGKGRHGGILLGRADADKDGRVSLAEAIARPLERFDRADANRDGTLTPEERKAAREAFRAQRQQRRG